MIPDWKCCICKEDADYKQGRRKYCQEHWNYGEPAKPTLKDATFHVKQEEEHGRQY